MCYFPFHFTAQKAHRNSYCLEAKGMEKRKKKYKEWYFFIKVGTFGLSKLLQTTA